MSRYYRDYEITICGRHQHRLGIFPKKFYTENLKNNWLKYTTLKSLLEQHYCSVEMDSNRYTGRKNNTQWKHKLVSVGFEPNTLVMPAMLVLAPFGGFPVIAEITCSHTFTKEINHENFLPWQENRPWMSLDHHLPPPTGATGFQFYRFWFFE